jgi:hypothetical protein
MNLADKNPVYSWIFVGTVLDEFYRAKGQIYYNLFFQLYFFNKASEVIVDDYIFI